MSQTRFLSGSYIVPPCIGNNRGILAAPNGHVVARHVQISHRCSSSLSDKDIHASRSKAFCLPNLYKAPTMNSSAVNPGSKLRACVFAMFAVTGFATGANATPVTYDLTLTPVSPLGFSGTGTFTIDGPANPAINQTFSVSNGGLLALQLNIAGHTYSLANATSPNSLVDFVLGNPSAIGFAAGTVDVGVSTSALTYTYYDFSSGYPGIRSNGHIAYTLAPPPPPANPVPEPLTLSLAAVGLGAMAMTRKGRKAT